MDLNFLSDAFLKQIGFDLLPPEEQDSMLESMQSIIFEAVILRAVGEMNEADQAEFEKLMNDDKQDPDVAMKFLTEHVPYLQMIADDETEKFKYDTLTVLHEAVTATPEPTSQKQ